MNEQELLYYFPYAIDKQYNFRHFANDRNGFCRKYIPTYDGTNTQEFLYEKSGLGEAEIHDFEYLYENYSRWCDWYKNGKNIFSFSKELLEMLNRTDVNEVTPDSFHLPYDVFYLSLRALNIKISKDSDEIIEGVYVDHNIWNPMGEHPEGYCDLSFYFVGNFKKLYLNYIPKVKSRLEYTTGKFDETPIGSFWNVWLSFEKRERRKNVKQAIDYFLQGLKEEIFLNKPDGNEVTDVDLDFFNSTISLLDNVLSLVINCMLYLSQSTEKTDIATKFPTGLPNNLDKKLSFAKTRKEVEKVSNKIDQLGFTKIHYVGQSFKKQLYTSLGGGEVESHWRRGHWRNQPFGSGLTQSKLVWIKPTVVRADKGDPQLGHIYNTK